MGSEIHKLRLTAHYCPWRTIITKKIRALDNSIAAINTCAHIHVHINLYIYNIICAVNRVRVCVCLQADYQEASAVEKVKKHASPKLHPLPLTSAERASLHEWLEMRTYARTHTYVYTACGHCKCTQLCKCILKRLRDDNEMLCFCFLFLRLRMYECIWASLDECVCVCVCRSMKKMCTYYVQVCVWKALFCRVYWKWTSTHLQPHTHTYMHII